MVDGSVTSMAPSIHTLDDNSSANKTDNGYGERG